MKPREFVLGETQDIEETIEALENVLAETQSEQYRHVLIATFLSNLYMGVERLLRLKMKLLGQEIVKTESWHKQLLLRSRESGIVAESDYDPLLDCSRFDIFILMATRST